MLSLKNTYAQYATNALFLTHVKKFYLHPLLKFKQNEFSNLQDVVHYVKEHQMKSEHPTRYLIHCSKKNRTFE